jgi:hypothetical protein
MENRKFRDYDENRNDEHFRDSAWERYERETFSTKPKEEDRDDDNWPDEDR